MSYRHARVRALPGQRLAIRVLGATPEQDVLLAVPGLHPQMPGPIRVQVFELVLRRLYGEACDLAQATADEIEHRAAARQRLAALMAQTPHRNARGTVAA